MGLILASYLIGYVEVDKGEYQAKPRKMLLWIIKHVVDFTGF